MNETWKQIPGFHYSVSNLGRVRNDLTNKMKVPSINKYGYPCVNIYKNGKSYPNRIHRLVAEAFIPNPQNKPQVNHKSGFKLDNWVGNLEWSTAKENMEHASVNNLVNRIPNYGMRGKKNPNAGSKGKPVRIVETGKVYKNIAACAKAINGRDRGICDALKGRTHTHRGFHFEYIS